MGGGELVTDKGRPDHYYRKAREEGYAARSVYKLEALDQKYKLLRAGARVLDLGAAPGSWLEYAAERLGPEGLVVGVDRAPYPGKCPPSAVYIERDVFDLNPLELMADGGRFDVVLSDLAPRTTGARDADHQASLALCERARFLAEALLAPGGAFLCKMYQGEGSRGFLDALRRRFTLTKTQKPQASRRQSREVFFLGLGFIPA